MPIAAVRQAVVFGNVQVSTQALEFLATLEVPVVYMTPYGRFVAALMPAPAKNTSLRADQYRVFADPARALALAKEVVRAKVANQRTLLMRSLRTRPAGDPGTTPEPSRGSDEPAARDMADLLARLDRVGDLGALLGTEGQAASLYFGEFGRMLHFPQFCDGRSPKTPGNPGVPWINAVHGGSRGGAETRQPLEFPGKTANSRGRKLRKVQEDAQGPGFGPPVRLPLS